MNILIANDDGIKAIGIKRLAEALSEIADVYISAPVSQRSATGHGITMHNDVTAEKYDFECAKGAYAISGTPADCVKLGIELLRRDGVEIDVVFSGINLGSNLGTDVLYSGTVSAALEGKIKGYPSVAVSVKGDAPTHFDYACALAVQAAKYVYEKRDSVPCISLNVPDIPACDVKGVRAGFLGVKLYEENYQITGEKDGVISFRYAGEPVHFEIQDPMSDVSLVDQGYATVTPLKLDLTDYTLMNEAEVWSASVESEIIY